MSAPAPTSDPRPLVMVMVGTHHCPFDRLVQWADQFAAQHSEIRVLVQHGASTPPQVAQGRDSFTPAEMAVLREEAQVLVCHGGPSIMMEWVRSGDFFPIVVARNPSLGEHIDDHQIRFAHLMQDRGLVTLADTSAELAKAIEAVLAGALSRSGSIPAPTIVAAKNVAALAQNLVKYPANK